MARSPRNRQIFPLMVTLILVITTHSDPAEAFHSGGVGDCNGCHSIHRPDGGNAGTGNDNSIALMVSDPGSTCLKCHLIVGEKLPSSYLVATADEDMPPGIPPSQLSPGGDFGWLKKNYRWGDGDGGGSPGDRHGHNIVALDYRFAPDAGRTTAPGGSFPAARLSCISCHDPHGKYRRLADGTIGTAGMPIQASGSYATSPDPSGSGAVGVYRLLGGKGYVTSLNDGAPFAADPPAAVSPENYNRPEDRGETRVAYGKGMSEWCANCHPALLGGSGGKKAHPAGNNIKFSAAVAANYNAYVASGNLTGNPSTSYSSMVPFEMGTANYAALKGTAASTGGLRGRGSKEWASTAKTTSRGGSVSRARASSITSARPKAWVERRRTSAGRGPAWASKRCSVPGGAPDAQASIRNTAGAPAQRV